MDFLANLFGYDTTEYQNQPYNMGSFSAEEDEDVMPLSLAPQYNQSGGDAVRSYMRDGKRVRGYNRRSRSRSRSRSKSRTTRRRTRSRKASRRTRSRRRSRKGSRRTRSRSRSKSRTTRRRSRRRSRSRSISSTRPKTKAECDRTPGYQWVKASTRGGKRIPGYCRKVRGGRSRQTSKKGSRKTSRGRSRSGSNLKTALSYIWYKDAKKIEGTKGANRRVKAVPRGKISAGFGPASVLSPTMGSATSPTMGSAKSPTMGSAKSPTMGSATSPTMGSAKSPTMGSAKSPTMGSATSPTMGSATSPTMGSAKSPTMGSAKATPSAKSFPGSGKTAESASAFPGSAKKSAAAPPGGLFGQIKAGQKLKNVAKPCIDLTKTECESRKDCNYDGLKCKSGAKSDTLQNKIVSGMGESEAMKKFMKMKK